ncbi:MAG TPA: substrate-binding domain-containing protein [Solirubrobacterales bacterium]
MSRTIRAPRRGFSAVLAGAISLSLAALAVFGLAPQANAAFTTGKCAGADIVGRGASFARDAHNVFINNFKPIYCKGTPKLAGVTYEALGSGAGRASVKVREVGGPRFGMSDEPPTTAEIGEMNAGGTITGGVFTADSDPSNDGKIHVIPAAVGAVAPLVNFPNGCDVTKLDVASRTAEENLDLDGTPDDVVRVLFTKAEFEAIWSQGTSGDPLVTWRDVFGELDDTAACKMPIIRVVRFDDSGTSFAFKDYLNTIDPGEGWLTTYATSDTTNKTKIWPGAELGESVQCPGKVAPGKQEDALDHLTSGCANGNGELVKKLVEVDGSVGYSDISTARSNSTGSLAIEPEKNDNDTYWTQIQNGANDFEEPTSSPIGFRSDGPKGANCQDTEFENVPVSTFGNWEKASGVKSETGYGICTMTYGLVFDDNSDVWGGSPAEEAKARTVKDYWENIVTDQAQAALFPNDYAPLPEGILTIARAGVASVNWEGAAGGGGGGGTGGGSSGGGGAVVLSPPPSNLFSLPKKSISSQTGQATVSVKVPGPGKVELIGTANVPSGKASRVYMKKIMVGKVVLTAGKAGTYNLTLKPSGAAKKRLREKGKLQVKLQVTFTPTGGTAKTTNSTVTLKLKKGK